MKDLNEFEVWFLTGSQHLYGSEVLEQVASHSQEIAAALQASSAIPTRVIFKPVLTTPEEIHTICLEANTASGCVGVIAWMHTFSPAKNWIAGLSVLKKPLAWEAGYMPAPGEPGLGVVLNETVIESHPYNSGGRLHLEMCQAVLDSNNQKVITELDE